MKFVVALRGAWDRSACVRVSTFGKVVRGRGRGSSHGGGGRRDRVSSLQAEQGVVVARVGWTRSEGVHSSGQGTSVEDTKFEPVDCKACTIYFSINHYVFHFSF